MTKKLTIITLLLSLLAAAGCNTVDGVGKDLQDAGETISDTAN